MFYFGKSSIENLKGVHPALILVLSRGLLYSPDDWKIIEGVRDHVRQRYLVSKGWSKTYDSKHMLQWDGFSHAVDIMIVGDINEDGNVDHRDKALTWDRALYVTMSECVKKAANELRIEVECGVDWEEKYGFFDGPHVQLGARYRV